jgi:NAD(P)H-hydrate epimerase
MREWEQATWASGQTEKAVIHCAGTAVARAAEHWTRPGARIVVLAGQGHNGDDALVAAEAIRDRVIETVRVTDPAATTAQLPAQLESGCALLLDGLFGIGLNRPLSAPWLHLIRLINGSGVPVLAVDVPSGLNADSGLPMDDAIRAAHTLTLGAVKEGLIRPTAWPYVGRLDVAADIGLTPCPFQAELNWTLASDFAGLPPPRSPASHKGTYGHALIVAGSLGYHGAGVLAARGAQRAQPGLITLLPTANVYAPVAAQLQSVMVQPWNDDVALPRGTTVVLAGPGLAGRDVTDAIRQSIARWWRESPLAVIADASALEALPAGPTPAGAIRVITPHPGEAARMLGQNSGAVQDNRLAAVRELSRRWGGCLVVLKGHQTLVGAAAGPVFLNGTGNPHLAQGGSGDLLAGYLAGLLAQPAWQVDAVRAVRFAVGQHGAAADTLQAHSRNWTIEELAGIIGACPMESLR